MLDRLLSLINKRQRDLFQRNLRLEEQKLEAEQRVRALEKVVLEMTDVAISHCVVIKAGVERSDGPSIRLSTDTLHQRMVGYRTKVKELDYF
ncbi:hypothetical protein PARSHIK_140 [Erwinia phage vB_EamM_Parshik]|uniref:Uncharacterized protein n=1 Tax=Erwinia phage vB_EamM_Huxley TaxID=1883373 RepID=A0A1B2ID89_9CAUD|nr:hypothetical protein BIZ81_gp144 [Erwinia phage vB_EamM_Huxley]ANZ49221.1 hypothetical protein HUXLEY_139 [Erwinia phage vB_EamM_Huxley]ANZ50049.1 hypothetical protein PARSHIK_140 [Erwinia phage vB_EamM_Parshik]